MTTLPIAAVILTYNEEHNIRRCLESVQGRCAELIVVDSFSTDGTTEIASEYAARVYQHRYEGHPQQWKWLLARIPFESEWVFAIDADFEVTSELWSELNRVLANPSLDLSGVYVCHRQIFRGRFLRHGTIYPRYWLRVFQKSRVRVDENDLVDVHFLVDGKTATVEGDVIEDNVKDRKLDLWIEKQFRFAKKQAEEELNRRHRISGQRATRRLLGNPDERIACLKEMWYRAPGYARPFVLFFYRYIIRLGFLDGKPGLVYHFTQALLYRLMVDVLLDEQAGLSAQSQSDKGTGP
jgi:glycosyltransferase involved in cell wall biosynthesis